jgi:hypothetical protein
VLAFGKTGWGKSEFLNAYLQAQAFTVSDDPNSCTGETSSSENIVSFDLRTAIDTQGIEDTEGVDAAHVQQMVAFLKAWPHGVNAFALVINGQSPRFDAGIQKLVKILNSFFNDATFWNHVCIIFTKWFVGMPSRQKETMRTRYRAEVLRLVHQLAGTENQNPPLPAFFVDSPKWASDAATHRELDDFHRFASGLSPLQATSVSDVNIQFWRVVLERHEDVLVDTRYEGNTRIRVYEDQQRERRIAYDGRTVTYGNWTATRQWDVRHSSSVRTERETRKIGETTTPVFRWEECGRRRHFGMAGPRDGRRQVLDHNEVTETYEERTREIRTDFDGQVTYSDWRKVRDWTRPRNAPPVIPPVTGPVSLLLAIFGLG